MPSPARDATILTIGLAVVILGAVLFAWGVAKFLDWISAVRRKHPRLGVVLGWGTLVTVVWWAMYAVSLVYAER